MKIIVIEWKISHEPVNYEEAVRVMEKRVHEIRLGRAQEQVWFLEHPSLYTAGTSAKKQDLIKPDELPVYKTGRGGSYTYHGPGQRIAYVMLDLTKRKHEENIDLHKYIDSLENWLIATLKNFDIIGKKRKNRVGIWVNTPKGNEAKIAAIGIRVRRWVTFHGISINNNPNLEYFNGIIPCGIRNFGVTSLAELGINVSMDEIDQVLTKEFSYYFMNN